MADESLAPTKEEYEKWLADLADKDCRDCDGSGVFYGNVHICPCISRGNHLAIAESKKMLTQAADWFDEYASIHYRKRDREKAERNRVRATACREIAESLPRCGLAISKLKLPTPAFVDKIHTIIRGCLSKAETAALLARIGEYLENNK